MVERVTERQGSIIVPQSADNLYQIGRVVFVGNGQDPEFVVSARGAGIMRVRPEPKESLVAVGDLVYFQTNMIMAAHQQYEYGTEAYLSLHQTELIARLASNVVNYDNFEPLGEWVLVQPHKREQDSRIVVPDTVKAGAFIYWTLAKKSVVSQLSVQLGQEIMVNTGRINPIFIPTLDIATAETKHTEFSYISSENILGVVDEGA